MIKGRLALWFLAGLLAMSARGQAAPAGTESDVNALAKKVAELIPAVPQPFLKKYLGRLQAEISGVQKDPGAARRLPALRQKIANAGRLVADLRDNAAWSDSAIFCYVAPAISPVRRLPDGLPEDGRATNVLRVIAAQGEFEPATFLVFACEDVAGVELKVSDLKGAAGMIPAAAVDLKVVKCWWQAGTAWSSYFPDPYRMLLVPELLLNDENLVKVETDPPANYLRVDGPAGSEYVWISGPENVDSGTTRDFNILREPVADSPTLRPIQLVAGDCKQIWLTVKVPEKAAAGFYSGTLQLCAAGQQIGSLALNLRVLPFALPNPKTYYDLDRDFMVSISTFIDLESTLPLTDDLAVVKRLVLAMLKDMRDHNIRVHKFGADLTRGKQDDTLLAVYLQLMKEADLNLDVVLGPYDAWDREVRNAAFRGEEPSAEAWRDFTDRTEKLDMFFKKNLPHTQFYAEGAGESPFRSIAAERTTFQYCAEKGMGIFAKAKLQNVLKAGIYNVDIIGAPLHPDDTLEKARLAHATGARLHCYASPHSGPENPSLIRRTHGLMLYKSDYDGTCEEQYFTKIWHRNTWNDFAIPSGSYRIDFVYVTRDGIIDTMHWEGFREGIDDIRYATKLCQLARDAIASGVVEKRYAARKALQYLACLDWQTADLDAARLEMIGYILELQKLLKGDA